jgi:hypothetical protein
LALSVLEILPGHIVIRELLVDAGHEVCVADQVAGNSVLVDDLIEVLFGEMDVQEVQCDGES